MGSPKLEPLTNSELAWIGDNLARATAMAKKYGGDADSAQRPTLAGLDGLWRAWSVALRESGDDPNALINMVGVALGQHLVDEAGLAWVIVTDELGTDLAVYGAKNEILVVPCNLVAKRWQSGEPEFVLRVGNELVATIRELTGRR